jgi:hypothetical protein
MSMHRVQGCARVKLLDSYGDTLYSRDVTIPDGHSTRDAEL